MPTMSTTKPHVAAPRGRAPRKKVDNIARNSTTNDPKHPAALTKPIIPVADHFAVAPVPKSAGLANSTTTTPITDSDGDVTMNKVDNHVPKVTTEDAKLDAGPSGHGSLGRHDKLQPCLIQIRDVHRQPPAPQTPAIRVPKN